MPNFETQVGATVKLVEPLMWLAAIVNGRNALVNLREEHVKPTRRFAAIFSWWC